MSDGSIMKKTDRKRAKIDWTALDAMTAEEKQRAALSDPDAQPITKEKWNRMKRVPRVRTLRRALGLSQEEFAGHFHIPIGTLRDWEQGRAEPDQAARAYLEVIAAAPDVVRNALGRKKIMLKQEARS
jgi:putative transcriptional regulator